MINREDIPEKRVVLTDGRIIWVKDRSKPIKKKYEQFLKTFTNKIEYLQRLSGKRIPECIKCGERDLRVLTENHLIDGRKDVRCMNCNFRYEYEKGRLFFNPQILQSHLKKEYIIKRWDRIEINN
jgi:DNA-directed RNA polymerase subunit RPC12/RpoP